jgi:hypothetical protein
MVEAAEALKGLLLSQSEAIRLKAAEAILRCGHELNLLLQLQADVMELKAASGGSGHAVRGVVA